MSSRYRDNLRAMLVKLGPIVRDRIRADVERDPGLVTTSAVVVADGTTTWGRRFVTNFLHEKPPQDAVATVAVVDLGVLEEAFGHDARLAAMLTAPLAPGYVRLFAIGQGNGGTMGVVGAHVAISEPAPTMLQAH